MLKPVAPETLPLRGRWRRFIVAAGLGMLAGLGACGGGGGGASTPAPEPTPTPVVDSRLAWGNAGFQTVLNAAPPSAAAPATTLTIHYRRPAGDYTGWTLHTWDAAEETSWTAGRTPTGSDAFGQIYSVPLKSNGGSVGYIFHKGDSKDHNDADQRYTLRPGANEIWRVQGDLATYTANPLTGAAPDTRVVSTRDARAVWLNRQLVQWPGVTAASGLTVKLYHSATGQVSATLDGSVSGADGSITLDGYTGTVPAAAATRFKWVDAGGVFSVKDGDLSRLPLLHRSQLVLVQENAAGQVQNATTAQVAGALDDLYAAAANVADLGVTVGTAATAFKLWAPTAQKAYLYTYPSATADAATIDEMTLDAATGVYSASRSGDLSGQYYRYAVEVHVRGVGLVRNLVTDPYSVSLNTNSQRSYIAKLSAANLKPAGWDASPIPNRVAASTDLVVYELHVRDFSANDGSVSAANRGKYGAFSEAGSNGMKHLKALADAGVTDVHLLPVYDFATVPETGCTTPIPSGAADAQTQQATVTATASTDCFNWGYDPWHYGAPEGSYASDAGDGAKRILEFRQMVMGLHAAGLRVGMDVVYNHTVASGQNGNSVLDRLVPGYYHRLLADGSVANSTCCDNTAPENLMMGKLVVDTAITWAREYKIASFRFDIMGHLPRALLEQLQTAVNAATGRSVQLFGEGWNFGEVAGGARFPQAVQGGLNGTAIGSFGDKMRDAARGGSGFDSGSALVANQGWLNGLWFDPNAQAGNRPLNDLRWAGDLIKGALAGSIADYTLTTHWDATLKLKDIGGVGFAQQPAEVVNYVENHDNQTLWDNDTYKLPLATSREDRARVQLLGAALVAFSQGTAYFHAGMDVLRSKSLDVNSYDSGDWFNRLDWTYADNNFGVGLPPQPANGGNWSVMQPLLANPLLKPQPGDIAWMRDAFRDLLKIRASTTLLRLRTAADIQARLKFYNLGSSQLPTVLAARIDGQGYAGANFGELVYLVNTGTAAQTLTVPELAGKAYTLHPVHAAAGATDRRAATGASFGKATGAFTVPARAAVVFVVN